MKPSYLQRIFLAAILYAAINMINIQQAFGGCGFKKPNTYISQYNYKRYYYAADITAGASYTWIMGDGNVKKGNWFDYTYATEGKYDLKLVLADSAKGCTDTFFIGTYCIMNTGFTTQFKSPLTYSFKANTTTTKKRSFLWTFYGTTTDTGKSVTHTFPKKGQYAPKLTIYDSTFGCSSSEAPSLLVANCAWNSYKDTLATFNDCYTNHKTQLSYWNTTTYGSNMTGKIRWGDGNTDTFNSRKYAIIEKHTYASGGYKTITLIYTDSASCTDSITNTRYVEDTAFNNLYFAFTASINKYVATFNVTSKTAYTFKEYDFGDGSKGYGSYMTHTYKTKDSFNVCAIFKNYDQSCSTKKCSTIIINAAWTKCGKSKPSMTGTWVTGTKFQFWVSMTTGLSYKWLTGDGAAMYGYYGNYTYASEGKYTVRCIVSDSINGCSDTFLLGDMCALNPDYSVTKISGAFKYEFKSLNSKTSNRSFAWTYKTGATGTGATSQYTYSAKGSFQTKLVIYDSTWNCSNSVMKYVTINKCAPYDSLFFRNSCNTNKGGDVFYYNNSAPGSNLSGTIDWADGTTDTVLNRYKAFNKSHTWASKGNKKIYLYVKDSSACLDTIAVGATISDTAFGNQYFTFNSSVSNRVVSLSITDSSKAFFKYWEFGDGSKSTTRNTAHMYPNKTASYNLCAVLYSTEHPVCIRNICKTIKISVPKCGATFKRYADTAKKFSVKITNYSYGSRYHWDFGDGDTSNSYTPKHTYTGLGPFALCITAYDSACTSTWCDTLGFDSSGVMNRGYSIELNVYDQNGQQTNSSKNIRQSHVHVYPNPANNILNIKGVRGTNNILQLFSAQGRLVLSVPLANSNHLQVDISKLTDGYYFGKITNGENGSTGFSVVVQH